MESQNDDVSLLQLGNASLFVRSLPSTCVATSKYVSPTLIETHMRMIASKVYGLNPKTKRKELLRWSSHSLRVGACVLLHSLGYTDVQLQHLLRWKSLAFMNYLRDLICLSDKHAQVLDEAAAMPNFF